MPKVSVLMPIYKTNEVHLREAIESILNQTYTDFEFLILNDSPEEIYLDDIVTSYADERIVYSKNDMNMGITPSRNKLINLAKGEYLAVMDHDDISLPKRFEKEVEFLDKHADYGVVSCGFYSTESDKPGYYPTEDILIKESLLRTCALMHPASMMRKSVLLAENIHYEEKFSPSEDYALWCRLITKTKFYNIPEVLFQYRIHSLRTSNVQKEKMKSATKEIYKFVRKTKPFKGFILYCKECIRALLHLVFYNTKIIVKDESSHKISYSLFGMVLLYTKKK